MITALYAGLCGLLLVTLYVRVSQDAFEDVQFLGRLLGN
jgi:hypothetical protein